MSYVTKDKSVPMQSVTYAKHWGKWTKRSKMVLFLCYDNLDCMHNVCKIKSNTYKNTLSPKIF